MNNTENLDLALPIVTEEYSIDIVNENSVKIDNAYKKLDDTVNGISIGCSNLIENSEFSTRRCWAVYGNVSFIDSFYNEKIGAYYAYDSTNQGLFLQQLISENIEKGVQYTLSFYAKGIESIRSLITDICDITKPIIVDGEEQTTTYTSAETTIALTTEWVRHTITFYTGTSDENHFLRFYAVSGGTVTIACPQLERGNVATDWKKNTYDAVAGNVQIFSNPKMEDGTNKTGIFYRENSTSSMKQLATKTDLNALSTPIAISYQQDDGYFIIGLDSVESAFSGQFYFNNVPQITNSTYSLYDANDTNVGTINFGTVSSGVTYDANRLYSGYYKNNVLYLSLDIDNKVSTLNQSLSNVETSLIKNAFNNIISIPLNTNYTIPSDGYITLIINGTGKEYAIVYVNSVTMITHAHAANTNTYGKDTKSLYVKKGMVVKWGGENIHSASTLFYQELI